MCIEQGLLQQSVIKIIAQTNYLTLSFVLKRLWGQVLKLLKMTMLKKLFYSRIRCRKVHKEIDIQIKKSTTCGHERKGERKKWRIQREYLVFAPPLYWKKIIFVRKIYQKKTNNVIHFLCSSPFFLGNPGQHPSYSKCLDPPLKKTIYNYSQLFISCILCL